MLNEDATRAVAAARIDENLGKPLYDTYATSISGVLALVLGACAAKPEPAPIPATATPQPAPEAANARPDLDAGAPRIPCAKTSDCACTSHYTPISAREQRDAASPGDCMTFCRSGLCFAAQGPL